MTSPCLAYHLTPATWYREQPAGEPYLPEEYQRDRFVHLTHGIEQVIQVGNRYYRASPEPWLLLTIDLAQVTAEVRYDDDARAYPHVYGPLDRAAIVAVQPVERDPDGRFVGVG